MTTYERSATANGTSQPSLIERAAQSTRDLGWLSDYITDWNMLRSVAIRIAAKQSQQTRKDEQAYMMLLELIAFAGNKLEAMEASYAKLYSAHERLMIKLESEG